MKYDDLRRTIEFNPDTGEYTVRVEFSRVFATTVSPDAGRYTWEALRDAEKGCRIKMAQALLGDWGEKARQLAVLSRPRMFGGPWGPTDDVAKIDALLRELEHMGDELIEREKPVR